VNVRRTHGGPAPDETAAALRESRAILERDASWAARAREALVAAGVRLTERTAAL
jgi:hypothetical protein